MKFILILFMVLGVTFAKVNLKRSIVRIEEQIKVTAENPAQWEKLPTIIGMALPCLGALGVFKVESGGLPKGLQHYIETITPVTFANQLLQVEWGQVSLAANIEPNGWVEDLAAFMNTTKFNQVHELLWTNPEFLDLVGYLHEGEYWGIYQAIIGFYKAFGREDLVDSLPTGPPQYPPNQARRTGNAPRTTSTRSNFPIISMKSEIWNEAKAECGLPEIVAIVKVINASNIHEVIKVLLYLVQEVIGNSAMHILLMKFGEQQKGEFFHGLLSNPEMEELFPLIQGMVLSSPSIAQLNNILRQVTGLDIGNLALFKYIVNLIEYLVWNYPFPDA